MKRGPVLIAGPSASPYGASVPLGGCSGRKKKPSAHNAVAGVSGPRVRTTSVLTNCLSFYIQMFSNTSFGRTLVGSNFGGCCSNNLFVGTLPPSIESRAEKLRTAGFFSGHVQSRQGTHICNFGAPSPLDYISYLLQWSFVLVLQVSKEIIQKCGENCLISGQRKKRRIL